MRTIYGRNYLKDLIREIRKDKIDVTLRLVTKWCFITGVIWMLTDIIFQLIWANTL